MHMNKCNHGFSLVELSIVLVILGLLTGGILGGQALIKAAELRAVTTEVDTYQTAVHTFRDKYRAYPGDMGMAGRFWGYVNTGGGGNCSNPATDTGTGSETCDGNGNGTIDSAEMYRFWQHLSNAGMIQGEYTGVTGDGSAEHSVIGENVPASKFSNAGYTVRDLPNNPGWPGFYFAYDYGKVLHFGAAWADSLTHLPLLTPEDAWNIDTKMDDGKPVAGRVVINDYAACHETVSGEIVYELSNSGQTCVLNFTKVF